MSLSFLRRIAFCASVGALFCATTVARASDFVVTNAADSGTGSLRAALALANANTDADTISFDPSLGGQTITLTSGELSVSSSVSIEGPTKGITVSGNDNSRVFLVAVINPLFSNIVSLSNLTISHGNNNDIGSGIYNGGTLHLSNCTVADNTAVTQGGGLFSPGGPVTLSDCTFTRNHATGGGAAFYNNSQSVTVSNCTFYGNTTPGGGGGIVNNSAQISIDSCTFSFNSAANGADIYTYGGSLNLKNTILNDSIFNDSRGSGAVISQGYNLFKTGNGFVGNGSTDKSATDLGLGTLANNGGPTETVALLANSPALDAGSATGQDQRGKARPADLSSATNAMDGSDIGAYERQDEGGAGVFVVSTTDDVVADDGHISLREAIIAANDQAQTSESPVPITFDSNIFGNAKKTITLSSNLTATKGEVTIEGPSGPGAGVTIDGAGHMMLDSFAGNLTASNLALKHGGDGVLAEGGNITLRSCTISDSHDGGFGVFINPRYTATLDNCTISDNSAGGIVVSVASTVTLRGCTVTRNGTQGIFIYNDNLPTTLNISNSIVAGNAADFKTYASPSNGNAVINDTGYNLIGNNAGVEAAFSAGTPNANHDLVGTSANPLIAGFDPAGLKDNGGPTPTIALLGTSPAVNVGSTTLTTDQRGVQRDAKPDIGSYELTTLALNVTLTPARPATNDILTATASPVPAIPAGSYLYTYVWTRKRGTTTTTIKTTANTPNATDTLDLSQQGVGDKDDVISVAVTVTDSDTSRSASDALSARVANTAPTASPLTVGGTVGQSLSAKIVASDIDADTLTYSVAVGRLPAGLSLNASTGQISGIPTAPANNTHVSIRVNDGTVNTVVVATFDIVEASSLVVNVYNDIVNSYDGKTSLREAILASDLHAKSNVITFDPAVFSVARVIVLGGNSLALSANTTISGPAVGVTISANGASRVFDIGVTRRITVSMSNLKVIAGRVTGNGGGFYVPFGSSLLLSNCTLSGNRAQASGSETGQGGAIFLDGNGVLSLNGCTLSENVALGGGTGGAIHIANGRSSLVNCTLSGNSTSQGGINGGAVWTHSGLSLSSCTVANNKAGGSSSAGGVLVAGGSLLSQNTIIAANTAGAPDVVGAFASAGNNLIGNAGSLTRFASTDMRGTSMSPLNPRLAPLGSNGGLSKTQALLQGSPAIDRGNTSLTVDERGVSRPQGASDDIGAFELATPSRDSRSLDAEPSISADGTSSGEEQSDESPVPARNPSGGSA